VDYFISQFNPDKGHADLPAHEIARISSYEWPGNVRELQSAIHRFFALGKLGLPTDPIDANKPAIEIDNGKTTKKLKEALENFEKQFILHALKTNMWRKGKTASYLGIDPKTLYRKTAKLGL
jgi:DNA-binding NtrC family response regulator